MRTGSRRALWVAAVLISTMIAASRLEETLAQATLSTGSGARQISPFHYRVKVELVDLFASVHDSRGKMVTKLRRDDFVIYDNGSPQRITEFSRNYYPLSVLLLLDTSSSMAGQKLENARRSLAQFLKRLNPGDEAMLITFQSKPRIIEGFTQHLEYIRRDLWHTEGYGSTALYDAILMALDQVDKAHNRRKALLLISDGINTYGRTQLKDTLEILRRRGVELFTIGMGTDLPEDARERAATRSILNQLTESAGGESYMVSDSKDLPKICRTISEHMHNQYNLGYYPPESKESSWRIIRVETRIPGLRVVASKTGYYPSQSGSTH